MLSALYHSFIISCHLSLLNCRSVLHSHLSQSSHICSYYPSLDHEGLFYFYYIFERSSVYLNRSIGEGILLIYVIEIKDVNDNKTVASLFIQLDITATSDYPCYWIAE